MACCFCCAVGLRRLAAPTFGGRLLLLLCRSAFDGWLLLRLRCSAAIARLFLRRIEIRRIYRFSQRKGLR
jgi:hypothetical protein